VKARIRRVGTSAVVKLSGKIVIGSGNEDLEEVVAELVEGGAGRIVLDLERVSYIDSSGLGSMVACRRTASERGVEVVLLRPAGKVADLLALSGLEEVFPIFHDEAEALVG